MKVEADHECAGVLGWLMLAVPPSRKRTKVATVEADRLWIIDELHLQDANHS